MIKSMAITKKTNNNNSKTVQINDLQPMYSQSVTLISDNQICDTLIHLRKLSQSKNLSFLTTILEIAYHEAFMIANRVIPTPIEKEELKRIVEMGQNWQDQTSRA